ncbi:Hypothetical predicted protein [Lynx pardinus]|uniref:Uncharacterized protein n=1 Tax=Lynx pardinus TaxID=191816 RepID=A0A485PQ55_LYNPA|nr:Hypothetical predicted protein [Lynx pardinus]
MAQVSQILQDHGHDVILLQQNGLSFTLGCSQLRENKSYTQVYLRTKFAGHLSGSVGWVSNFGSGHDLMLHDTTQCSHFLGRTDIMGSLKNESFDLVVVDAIGSLHFPGC